MSCRWGYDALIIILNVVELCLSATASGLLGHVFQPTDIPIKLQIVYATLVGCLLVNLIMIASITIGSRTTIQLWLRALLSALGATMLITSGTFLLVDNPDDNAIYVTAAAILMLVNAVFYVADALVILRFYLYALFCVEDEY